MDNTVDIRANARLRRHCRYSAFLGAGVWFCAFPFLPKGEIGMIAAILLFVPLVLIRLGFAFLIPHGPVLHYRWWYIVSYSQLPAALLLAAGFLLPAGVNAMLLAVPWLFFTLMLGALTIDRILHQPRPKIDEWGQLAAMLFLPIGAGWALLSRAGLQPLGFREVIVLLTAIHFHYAGFALPLLAGELVRFFQNPSWGKHSCLPFGMANRNVYPTVNRLGKALLIAVLFGVPLTAIGITTTQLGGPREIELGAALLLAGCGVMLGFGHLWAALRMHDRVSGLLAISGLSLIVALGWSALYAMGQYGLIGQIDIPFMVHWHGAINAAGAALCGLFGWHLIITRAQYPMSLQP